MKGFLVTTAIGLSLLAPRAHAAEASDALSKCLVESVTEDDRRALVRWIFAAIAAHPDLEGYAAIDASQRGGMEAASAAVFERLIAQDCTAQAREAIASEGAEGFSEAFKTLGELAMGGVVEDGQVQAGMARLNDHIDTRRILKALLTK